jgi:hypothetical protein
MSVKGLGEAPWNSSGADHCMVPCEPGDDFMLMADVRRWMAAPKSHTLAMRSNVSMTFKLFKSPWVMKRRCRYSTADAISRAFLRRTWMGGGGTLPSISCKLPPLIHSMTYMGSALSWHAATTATQLGWRTLALMVSSSMNLLKSRSVREHCSGVLTATSMPSSSPCCTQPCAPDCEGNPAVNRTSRR